jgi:hypothetical protein
MSRRGCMVANNGRVLGGHTGRSTSTGCRSTRSSSEWQTTAVWGGLVSCALRQEAYGREFTQGAIGYVKFVQLPKDVYGSIHRKSIAEI